MYLNKSATRSRLVGRFLAVGVGFNGAETSRLFPGSPQSLFQSESTCEISVTVISFNFKNENNDFQKTLHVDTPQKRDGNSEMAHCHILGIISD